MSKGAAGCPDCGAAAARKNGRDRQGRQIRQCRVCGRRFTDRSATPFSGYRFPPDVIALAVRWYLRYRLSHAGVTELLAERGARVDASTVYDWVREFAPLYVYRAIDGRGQIVDVYVSDRRAAEDAAAFFRRAIAAVGVIPDAVTTDCAAAFPPALAAVLPPVAHETGKRAQRRIERNHQHLKGRLRPMRGFKTLAGARVVCRAHAFLRNLRRHFYEFGDAAGTATTSAGASLLRAWVWWPFTPS